MIDELSWLGGIWDGEGTIGIYKRKSYFVPSVSVSNTNEVLINKVKDILDFYNIEYYVEYSDRGDRTNARPAWAIKMESKPRVSKFLTLIKPYLISKQGQADLVISWCSKDARRRKLNTLDVELITELKQLNSRGRVR
tara:strand:+ start:453 stop:866 length:414 start_codon:yes stop_codon:yes gene_type:complete